MRTLLPPSDEGGGFAEGEDGGKKISIGILRKIISPSDASRQLPRQREPLIFFKIIAQQSPPLQSDLLFSLALALDAGGEITLAVGAAGNGEAFGDYLLAAVGALEAKSNQSAAQNDEHNGGYGDILCSIGIAFIYNKAKNAKTHGREKAALNGVSCAVKALGEIHIAEIFHIFYPPKSI